MRDKEETVCEATGVEKKYLTIGEFGERVGMNYEAIRRKVKAGEIKAVRFGPRKTRIGEAEYERWVLATLEEVN
jgi:excisionase family DNA binding protein